jgi:ribosomal protein L11 methyltransferase
MSAHKIIFDEPDRGKAHAIAAALQDLFDPGPSALTLFEHQPSQTNGLHWRIEAYYDDLPNAAGLTASLRDILGADVPAAQAADVPTLNWVALSQAALPPVLAGRFTVHGSHDAGRVQRGPFSILIDAGEAFGTAHHATTYGCLIALDRLTRAAQFEQVLDLGCGSGVLAIAVARANPQARIIATDLDAQSVKVAAENMRLNGVGHRIKTLCAKGLEAPELRRAPPFDLVIANILAGPLIELSGPIARALGAGGALVLSGLLTHQAPAVIAAYASKGLSLASHARINGWSTLVMQKR